VKRSLRPWGTAAAILVLAGAGIVYLRQASRSLVQRSRPLVNVRGWWKEDTLERPYTWLSETSLFSHSGWWRLSGPFTYDISTNIKTPLTRLQSLLGSDGDDQTAFWELSPDRRHIAWNIECYDTIHTATIDGREHKKWNLEGPGYGNSVSGLTWLSDGHRWNASTIDYESGKDRLSSIGDALGIERKPEALAKANAEALALAEPVLTVDNGVCEVDYTTAGRTNRLTFRDLDHGGLIAEVEVSPDHKHFAWTVGGVSVPPLIRLLHRIDPGYSFESRLYSSLFISGIDGSNVREVGRIEVKDDGVIQFLQWMPNGRTVTYVYRDEIYAIDVSACL